jgi:hypothetical protein
MAIEVAYTRQRGEQYSSSGASAEELNTFTFRDFEAATFIRGVLNLRRLSWEMRDFRKVVKPWNPFWDVPSSKERWQISVLKPGKPPNELYLTP